MLKGLTDRGYYQYWDVEAAKDIQIDPEDLYRTKHDNPLYPTPPDYTEYTGVSLQTAYCIFWALLLLHCILVTHLKCIFSKEFTAASWTTKVQHAVEAINLAESFEEWDEGGGSPAEHIRRWKNALAEIAVTTGLNGFFNLLMLLPIWVTGKKKSDFFLIVIHLILFPAAANVRARHHTIQPAIGVFPEEEAAYSLLSLLRWALPLAVVLATLLDLLLVWLYMRFGHPWSQILVKNKEETPQLQVASLQEQVASLSQELEEARRDREEGLEGKTREQKREQEEERLRASLASLQEQEAVAERAQVILLPHHAHLIILNMLLLLTN